MNRAHELGTWGEDQAARFLTGQGYQIVDRNFRSRFGEIDIIAAKDEFIAFVEVKLRKTSRYGTPASYVTRQKQKKLRLTASIWLQNRHSWLQPRFDVIEIYAPQGENTYPIPIRHIKNAF